jgi:hypothetical protein
VIGDAVQNVSKPCLRIDAIELRGLNQGVHDGGSLSAAIGSREQPCLAADGNLAVIVPISGRMSSSIIAGIHCTGEVRVAFRVSGAHQAMSCTWSYRPVL